MKIRAGFVSNSSSSSFSVRLDEISAREALRLLDYPSTAVENTSGDVDERNWKDDWTITVDLENNRLTGFTIMDNGDLSTYMQKWGIDSHKFSWDCD